MSVPTPLDVTWTAREALACAQCWAEFYEPEKTGFASPETYWLSLPPKTRDIYRRAANKNLLLAVVRGQAVALLPSASLRDADVAELGEAISVRQQWRIRRLVDAVYRIVARRDAPPEGLTAG
jgi:hypothetical protein